MQSIYLFWKSEISFLLHFQGRYFFVGVEYSIQVAGIKESKLWVC